MQIHFQSISKIAILTSYKSYLIEPSTMPATNPPGQKTHTYNLKVSMKHPQNIVGGGGV